MDGDALDDEEEEFLRAVARAPEQKAPSGSMETPLERLAHFKIAEKLGRGGMGIVYRAEDEKLRRTVALKVLPEDFDDDAHRRKRFLREARVAASISHPNVAAIHDVGEADGRVYIAMELASGATLRKRLDGGPLGVDEALRIARDVARGVSRAHARSIAHRDLKPDNVMVSDEGVVKVLDFGLAKPIDLEPSSGDDPENVTVTQEGRIIGTPGYMSPEQARGGAIDVRTDVFSMGVMLYEMLTGTRPFSGSTSMDTLIATSRDGFTPASKKNPRVPAQIDRVIAKCLEKDPADRYATAEDLLAALEAVRADATPGSRTRNLAIVAIATVAIGAGIWRMNAAKATDVEPSRIAADSNRTGADPPTRGAVPGSPGADPGSRGADPRSPGADPGSRGADPGSPGAGPGSRGADPGSPGAGPGSPGAGPGSPGAGPGSAGAGPASPGADPPRTGGAPRGGVALAKPLAPTPKPSAATSAPPPAVTASETPGGGVIQKSPY